MTSDPTRTPVRYAEALDSWRTDRPLPEAARPQLMLPLLSLRALTGIRRQVRQFLLTSLGVDPAVDVPDAVEDLLGRAVLVIDELTSNALRHGALPSSLHIGDEDAAWLVVVSDGAPDRPPTPARERPAGQGGYGLYVVADLAAAHGVHYEADRKLVWACIPKEC